MLPFFLQKEPTNNIIDYIVANKHVEKLHQISIIYKQISISFLFFYNQNLGSTCRGQIIVTFVVYVYLVCNLFFFSLASLVFFKLKFCLGTDWNFACLKTSEKLVSHSIVLLIKIFFTFERKLYGKRYYVLKKFGGKGN